MAILELKGLDIAVENVKIVEDITFNINAGEVHLLMGPNGAGKSSLLKTIMGLTPYKVVNGSILLDGKNIIDLKTI